MDEEATGDRLSLGEVECECRLRGRGAEVEGEGDLRRVCVKSCKEAECVAADAMGAGSGQANSESLGTPPDGIWCGNSDYKHR